MNVVSPNESVSLKREVVDYSPNKRWNCYKAVFLIVSLFARKHFRDKPQFSVRLTEVRPAGIGQHLLPHQSLICRYKG